MLLARNLKIAIDSIRSAKWRSLLTMLGIIIGVVSVVTTVSIGEGVKTQVKDQITRLGPDLITIRPGKVVNRDTAGHVSSVNLFPSAGTAAFNESDWKAMQNTPGLRAVVPFNVVTGVPSTTERSMDNSFIVGATTNVPEVLNHKVEFGEFFNEGDVNKRVAVIGKRVAEQLFAENVPIGKIMEIRGQQFVVRGVFEEFATSPLTTNTDYNTAVFIPYETSKHISNNQVQIYQVLAKPIDPVAVNGVTDALHQSILTARAGQDDFTILKQDENLAIANNILTLLTGLIAGIAAISLIVGGIGIMNIMLVSVTERTREIGIRKAVGATNKQIMSQFLVEAAVLSLVGGIIGVVISILANYMLRIFTSLQPVITVPITLVAITVALVVGIVFGVTPALRAARKDPIHALRYE
ncbi:MAG: hypothetical protein JWL85_366 [Candidatus Saccharibacteria bacterium]|nr:hypothetical protein [Candidatus Saccharibacteria bacterium]